MYTNEIFITKQQQYSHLFSISKTIKIRWTRHVGLSKRSKDRLISDVLLWTPWHGHANVGWPARTYLQQLCEGTQDIVWKTCWESWMVGMNGERVWKIHASCVSRSWYINVYIWHRITKYVLKEYIIFDIFCFKTTLPKKHWTHHYAYFLFSFITKQPVCRWQYIYVYIYIYIYKKQSKWLPQIDRGAISLYSNNKITKIARNSEFHLLYLQMSLFLYI